jgi:hypothetical protein
MPKMRHLVLPGLLLALLSAACGSTTPHCQTGCACQTQSDCSSGLSCVAGFCTAAQSCTTDLNCTNPADICVGGSCVPGSDDGGTPPTDGGTVDAGKHDAGPGTDGGKGSDGGDAGQSSDGGQGDAGQGADGGQGSDGGQAPDSGLLPDSGIPDAGCTLASQCASGVCQAGNCVACSAMAPCATGQVCDGLTGVCGPCGPTADCAAGQVCIGGACQACTASSQCVSPLVCCLTGSCTGTCVNPGCTSDTQCNPPAQICVAGACVAGCLSGICDAGLRCDSVDTGRCEPASGSGAPGAACTSFSDCGTTPGNSNSGDCLPLLLPDGGVDSFCSFVCEGTVQCPPGMACASFGGGGQCIPESLAGGTQYFGSSQIGQSCSPTGYTCDSTTGCGTYGTGSADVCSDTCLGPSSGVCPSGWQCNDVTYFSSVLDGGPASCTTNAQCTSVSPDAQCFTHALGGTDQCYLVFQQDACFETASGGPTGTTGSTCTTDTNCKFGLCNVGKCADPCCSSTDCPTGYACTPVVEQQYSVLMVCLPTTGTGAVGSACDPTATTNSCRSQTSSGPGVTTEGLCLPTDNYPGNSSTTGYCSDYCCDDSECGTGFTCTLVQIGTDNLGNGLFANACVEF